MFVVDLVKGASCSTAALQQQTADSSFEWLDADGASLIVTLRKARVTQCPNSLRNLVEVLLRRADDEPENSSAAESAGLGVAHLLPAVIECAHTVANDCFYMCTSV